MKGRGETLTQAEIEALLASLPAEQGGETTAGRPATVLGRQVRKWDFRKPDKFSKDHMRSLLALHQNLVRLASSALSARLRTSVTLRVTSVDQGLYEEYIDLLPAQSVINVVSLKPLEGSILMEFQPELVLVMLDRLLGGHGGPVDAKHEFTDIELALIRNLSRTLLEALREAWVNVAEVDPHIEDLLTSPQLVQLASPTDIVVIVLVEVQVGDHLGTISFCIPHLVLEPVMPRLSAQVWVAANRRRPATPEIRQQILANLRRVGVKVTAVLGETAVTVRELLDLQEGDVLLLSGDAGKRARLWVGEREKFVGVPGLVGGRMAVKISEVRGDDRDDRPA
jgi:flagellar motor switch protein FliM